MSTEDVVKKVETAMKNRAKFEYAVLAVITFFISNYYLTGLDPPSNMVQIFQWCLVAYLVLFTLDIVMPVFSTAVTTWNVVHPPQWVVVALESIAIMQKFVEGMPNIVCPYIKVPVPEEITGIKGEQVWK